MRRLSDQRGFTLVEVLVAASLMLVILSATMTVLAAASRHQRLVEQHNDTQDQTRTALDRLARDLRNLASGSDLSETQVLSGGATLPRSVERNLPDDLVFRTINDVRPASTFNVTNVKRVRYCLDSRNPERGVLWQQTQTWTTAVEKLMPTDTTCPGTGGWDPGADRVAAASVVNRIGGRNRPVFRYSGDAGTIIDTTETARADITRLRADLHVDPNPLSGRRESHLATAVFLRNQNREPVANIQITVLNHGSRLIELNGTGSEDPEGRPLREYQFYIDPPAVLPVCSGETPHASCLMPPSPRAQVSLPDTLVHTFVLKVTDPAGLVGVARQDFQWTK